MEWCGVPTIGLLYGKLVFYLVVEPPQLKKYANQNGSESFPQNLGVKSSKKFGPPPPPQFLLFTPFLKWSYVFHPENPESSKIQSPPLCHAAAYQDATSCGRFVEVSTKDAVITYNPYLISRYRGDGTDL